MSLSSLSEKAATVAFAATELLAGSFSCSSKVVAPTKHTDRRSTFFADRRWPHNAEQRKVFDLERP